MSIYENTFLIPKEVRWDYIRDNAKNSEIGQYVGDAMIVIEKENTTP